MEWAGRAGSAPHPSLGPPAVHTLRLLSQALVARAFQLQGFQLGQLVAQLLVVHQGLLLLLPLLLQLCLQAVHLALQLRDVPLGLQGREGSMGPGPTRGDRCVGTAAATPLTSILIFSSSARRVSTSLFKFSIWRSLGTEVLGSSSPTRRFQTAQLRSQMSLVGAQEWGVHFSEVPTVAFPSFF